MESGTIDNEAAMSAWFTRQRERLAPSLKYVVEISEQLVLNYIMTDKEFETYLQGQNHFHKTRNLLDMIQRKGAYYEFSECLRVTDQGELHKLIDETGYKQQATCRLTTLQYRVFCRYRIGDPRQLHVPPHLSERLEKQREALQGMEKVERLVDLMEDEGSLTSEMTRDIKQQPDNIEKANMLVGHVKKSTLYSYFVLTQFLDISQQKALMSKFSEEDTKTALGRMNDLLFNVYYNLLGAIALKHSELEEGLAVRVRDFVSLTLNRDSNAVDRIGVNEAHGNQSPGRKFELTELFSDQANIKPTRTVLLVGAPGAGKTTAVRQLAREATKKRTPHVPRPPFVIQLRSLDWTTETSLKCLLLRNGPDLAETEQDDVWRALLGEATEITVVLDGADEVPKGFFKSNPACVTGPDIKAHPKDILNNLISGKLLKEARVLVSSRYIGLEPCWKHFDRKVEVCGFNEKSLDRFLSNELPEYITEVQSFLETRTDIRSLLLTPLHAVTFVLRAKDPKHADDWLLQSRTELSLSLIDTLVKTKLRKDHGGSIARANLKKQGKNMRKLCKLAAELLCREDAIKTEMTSVDLKKAEISVDECVATGVFSEQVLADVGVYKSILMAHHQSILESLAALALEEEQILNLVTVNDGRHDIVLTNVVGILGNERIRKMLWYILSEEDEEKDLKKLTVVVRAVLVSKRRLLYDGVEFCQRIVLESQQQRLIEDLMHVLETRWLTSYGSEDGMLADQLIRHDPGHNTNDPLVRVLVYSIRDMKYCPQATALRHYGKVTAADISENAEHLHKISSVSFSFSTGITRETVAGVAAELGKLDNVMAVSMDGNIVGSSAEDESSVLRCLSLIQSLQYLSLSDCHLTSDDVGAVTSSCPHLRHMDISKNCGVRGGDVKRGQLTGLSVEWCDLAGDELLEMATSNGETLEYLNAIGNSKLTLAHINDILTCCPRLVELYTDDGCELVRALSERRKECRLNHLWLFACDLSSSSSSGLSDFLKVLLPFARYFSSSSVLSDVLTRHHSISSLTLYACHHFTPRIMLLLSSSMASITSLFISPHKDHPHPPCSSDVVSLVRAWPSLTQLWLDGVHYEWRTSDYIAVINALNASPALHVVGLDVRRLTVVEVCAVVRELTLPLTRLWLRVDYKKMEEYAEVMVERNPGVIQLLSGNCLHPTYARESGSYYKHLPPTLPVNFRREF